MSKIKECKWFNIDDKLVILVSIEYNQTVIRWSSIVYYNGDLAKHYSELYYNNPCEFYRRYINTNKLVVDKPFGEIDGKYILKLYKEGKFTF